MGQTEELHGETRNEVDLEEPDDINAAPTKAENRPIYPTIKGQSGTNGKGWTFSFIESGLINPTLFSAPSSKRREGESPRRSFNSR